MNLDDDDNIFCGAVVQPDPDEQFREDEDVDNPEIDQHSEHSSDGINSQGQHQEEPLIQRPQPETEVAVSPKPGHGFGTCTLCKKQFHKNASNHKVCPDPVCLAKQKSQRALSKRVGQKKREAAKQEKDAAQQEAQEKAAQEKKQMGKRKTATASHSSVASQEKAAQGKKQMGKRKSAPASHSSVASQKRRTHDSSRAFASATTGLFNSNLQENPHEAINPAKRPNAPQLKSLNTARPRHRTDGNIGAGGLKGNRERVTAAIQSYPTKGPLDKRNQVGLLLEWKESAEQILRKGYQIINFGLDHKAACMNIHCELMQEVADTAWQSRVRQGWEDGQELNLEAIQVDSHKMKNLHVCNQFIKVCISALNMISEEMYKVKANKAGQTKEATSPEVTQRHGKQVIEVFYIVHKAGKHKHEFVHADSVVQGDLMAIMPLVDYPVEPKFFPYHRMEAARQGPITRDDEDYAKKDVGRILEKINNRFSQLASTSGGASRLHDAMLKTTHRVRRGDLLVYLGDALHAFPAGYRERQEPFLYFKGRLADSPPADPASSEIKGGSAKAPDKQAPTVARASLTSQVDSEIIDNVAPPDHGGTGTVAPFAKAPSNQGETAGSKTAAVCSAPTDPASSESKGGLAKAPDKQAQTVTGVSLTSDVVSESINDVAPPDPGGTRTEVPLAKAPSNQDETVGSKAAAVCTNPKVAAKRALYDKDHDNRDTKGDTTNSTIEHGKAASSEVTAVLAASEVDTENKKTKEAEDHPDSHGVVDALYVLRYGDEELLDSAVVHNLIAAGYLTSNEAVKFYNKRYPKAEDEQTTTFENRFLEECNRKERIAKRLTSKLPTHINF
jgi:hypothetical protein